MSAPRRILTALLAAVSLTAVFLAAARPAHAGEEPKSPFPIRGTLAWHNFLSGPTAWDEEDYQRYLDRLAALGLNLVAFHCYTGGAERYAPYVEPLIRIEYRNVVPQAALDTSLTARWGYRSLAIPDFAPSTRDLFPRPEGAEAFGARCAVLARTNGERYGQAQALLRRVVEMAHARGIQVALGFEFGIHPPELASIVPPDSWLRGALLPDPTHPSSIEILRSTIDDILRAYPDMDWIWLWLHEHTMYVGAAVKAQMGSRFAEILRRDATFFRDSGSDDAAFTGVWSLAYVRLARDHIAARAPRVRLAVAGWGGGAQLPGILRGLHRALPRDIALACLNPGDGWASQPDLLSEIAKEREVLAIPWLEEDSRLWHLQPRVSALRDQVRLARGQGLAGVLGIHWRTEDVRANLEAFAALARDPGGAPDTDAFYLEDSRRQYGGEAARELAPVLARMDRERWLDALSSPEFFPYDPRWGRMAPELRTRLTDLAGQIEKLSASAARSDHRSNLEWLKENLRFTLLLDEAGRRMEPAYDLKDRWLRGEVDAKTAALGVARARAELEAAPVGEILESYARRVRSRGELGVLSSINQKLWLEWKELERFVAAVDIGGTRK